MITSTLRSLLERAATDPAFRAQLLANPALAEGLAREQIEGLLGDMAMLDGQLTDAMLDMAVGGGTVGRAMAKDGNVLMGCDTANHNEGGLRVKPR